MDAVPRADAGRSRRAHAARAMRGTDPETPPGPVVAGAGGFEPPSARSKVSCLTSLATPHQQNGFPLRSDPAGRLGVLANGPGKKLQEKSRGRVAAGVAGCQRTDARRGRGWG